ncbi:ATP-binding protein [uncultured Tessaracoccus sp.]|uniref:ATP-binding protein n=1 Tax=uncultured Tessaracoccus sp. TaxID=905023 RepID=UPI0025FBC3D7|nr:SbcC/MukB-like Walker B domain-containing protein [uncultured Tessaracoccus sp.]
MSDALFSALEVQESSAPGYRLHHFEMLNWGTFDEHIWRFVPGGETSLLTGDIGSGKSTIVDGITTLLMPPNRIAYNKAAGAATRERTLRSYVEGHYRAERGDDAHHSRTRGLREGRSSYSVLLAVFVNASLDEHVTLAQVFQQREATGQPYRFHITHAGELSIEEHFTDFGSDLRDLRRRLRSQGATIHDDFPKYRTNLRRLLGIPSDQALELFHQTVSMKSVGNLNDFVREHMLEPSPADERVQDIIGHFEDLTTAHDAVVRARKQLEALDPVARAAERYDAALAARALLELERDAARVWCTELHLRLLEEACDEGAARTDQLSERQGELEQRITELDDERQALFAERARLGGDRLAELERREREARAEADRRRARRAQFDEAVAGTGRAPVTGAEEFRALVGEAAAESARLEAGRQALLDDAVQLRVGANEQKARRSALRAELADLRGRTSNLPTEQVQLRAWLCRDLRIDEDALPFAGELVDVADEHAEWRGAAERVLRGFALSMLVPTRHYDAVSAWVNGHHLAVEDARGRRRGGRLVYEKVPQRVVPVRPAEPGTLVEVLALRPGPFEEYLRAQLVHRAGHHRARSLEEFRSPDHRRAVTREGQVRTGDRHEKDDRHRVDDPRRFVLGWVNERKIAALIEDLEAIRHSLDETDVEERELQRRQEQLTRQAHAWRDVARATSWRDLDHEEATAEADACRDEATRLREGSDALLEIQRRIDEVGARLRDERAARDEVTGDLAQVRHALARDGEERERDRAFLATLGDEQRARVDEARPLLEARTADRQPASVEACNALGTELARELHDAIEQRSEELRGHTSSLTTSMDAVLNRWPELRSDMDANVEARGDFLALRRTLAEDDLPRFEGEFKELLNQHTIQELAAFNNWLSRQAGAITDRIARINEALGAVPYGDGTHLRLEKEPSAHQEVAQFRADLRNLTDDVLAVDGDTYSEQRFTEVRRIIERFRGREGHADADRLWTRRVTDVRNWFVFSASERYSATGEEREHYSDSDGKSGGQKEKLAYTILAASLAYQFGIEWGASQSGAFQFAVIDEAFGRGSDASTRYALELFAKLGLQLLIVTPLQKVQVIEPYVSAIGFVDNVDGARSRVHTLTINEYRARKAGR